MRITPRTCDRRAVLLVVVVLLMSFATSGATSGQARAPGSIRAPQASMVLAQSLAAQPPSRALASQTQQCPAAPYGVQHTAPGAGRTVALTFDDGPGPSTTAILEVLDRSDVTATFFNLGVNTVARPQTFGPKRLAD